MTNTLVLRTAILSRLFEHLRAHYDIEPEMGPVEGHPLGESEIEGLLAFKSDPQLEALRGALSRLNNGSFGTCLKCKRAMSSTQLGDDLTKRLCPACEREIATRVPTFTDRMTMSDSDF